jgi:hypothetical protein
MTAQSLIHFIVSMQSMFNGNEQREYEPESDPDDQITVETDFQTNPVLLDRN